MKTITFVVLVIVISIFGCTAVNITNSVTACINEHGIPIISDSGFMIRCDAAPIYKEAK